MVSRCLLLCCLRYLIIIFFEFGHHVSRTFPWCSAEAYDTLDPNGNITVKWDVMQWTEDGYVVRKQFLLV
jgi:hypothetical protein